MKINKPILTIFVLIATVSFVFFLLIPKYQDFVILEDNLVKKQAEYSNKLAYYENIFILAKEIQDRKDILNKIDSALPTDTSFASLIYFLQSKSAENGLVLKSIMFPQATTPYGKQAQAEGKTKSSILNVSLSGNYQNLKNFLASLDNSVPLSEVNSISFISAGISSTFNPKNQSDIYDFRLEIQTYNY